jgi:hypothetical protein
MSWFARTLDVVGIAALLALASAWFVLAEQRDRLDQLDHGRRDRARRLRVTQTRGYAAGDRAGGQTGA